MEQEEEQYLRSVLIETLRDRLGDPKWEGSEWASMARLLLGEQWEASAYESLARNLIQESMARGDEDLAREALSILERATNTYPENIACTEMLVACYLRFGPKDKLDVALAKLKQLAPDSKVLQVVDSVSEESAREFIEEMNKRVDRLFQIANGEDPELGAEALADLRRIIANFPKNRGYREKYAFALLGSGEKALALKDAERLAHDVPANHRAHFNLGQVFWHAGDPKRGRHYLELSMRYSQSDEERGDVRDAIATCEHWYGKQPASSVGLTRSGRASRSRHRRRMDDEVRGRFTNVRVRERRVTDLRCDDVSPVLADLETDRHRNVARVGRRTPIEPSNRHNPKAKPLSGSHS